MTWGIFETEAQRHEARAVEHRRLGHPEHYAIRSEQKAANWRAKAPRVTYDRNAFDLWAREAATSLKDEITRSICD